MSREYKPLSTIAEILGGFAFKGEDFSTAGFPVVKIANISPPLVNLDDCDRISPDKVIGLDRFKLNRGDIVLAMTGATIGKVGRIQSDETAYLNQRVAKISSLIGKQFDDFIFAVVTQSFFEEEVKSRGSGSAQSNISTTGIGSIKVPILAESEMISIGRITRAIDNKIELNQRMNDTFKAIARAVFKSWFVDFGPVRAKAEGREPYGIDIETAALFPSTFEDSELGEIPYGWVVGKVADLGEVICGKTPSTRDPENFGSDIPFITIPDMHGKTFISETERLLSKKGATSQQKKMLPAKSICVSCIATPGLVALTSVSSQTNQQINSVVPNKRFGSYFCFGILDRLGAEIRTRGSGGSVFSNLNTGDFSRIPVLLAADKIVQKYNELAKIFFDVILNNERQSQTLASLRNLLLPKLLSGELHIQEAEKRIAEVA